MSKSVGTDIRVSLSRSLTKKKGDFDFVKTIAGAEATLPPGLSIKDGLAILGREIDEYLNEGMEKKAMSAPTVATRVATTAPSSSTKYPEIKSDTGQLLAHVFEEQGGLRFTVVPGIKIDPKCAPIQNFLITKSLEPMAAHDKETGALHCLTYQIIPNTGGGLAEIRVQNIDDESRFKKVHSQVKWTIVTAAKPKLS